MCPTRPSNPRYRGYCCRCFGYLYPDEPAVRNYKTKERMVADYIRETFPTYDWRFDIPLADACSKFRPDISIDLGTHLVFVEVDENQHEGYDNQCELRRMNALYLDGGLRPILFLRFNPDKYDHVRSCFYHGKDGTLKCKTEEWNRRKVVLFDTLTRMLHCTTFVQPVEHVHLFYDGCNM